jgi:ferredoxin
MHVTTKPDRCIASGQCVMIAPGVFDQDEDGIVVLLDERPDEAERDSVEESIRICPASALAAVG